MFPSISRFHSSSTCSFETPIIWRVSPLEELRVTLPFLYADMHQPVSSCSTETSGCSSSVERSSSYNAERFSTGGFTSPEPSAWIRPYIRKPFKVRRPELPTPSTHQRHQVAGGVGARTVSPAYVDISGQVVARRRARRLAGWWRVAKSIPEVGGAIPQARGQALPTPDLLRVQPARPDWRSGSALDDQARTVAARVVSQKPPNRPSAFRPQLASVWKHG